MGYVWALALAGLFLIYLEFVLPGGIMAIGGGALLLSSLVLFFLSKPVHHFFVLYILVLSVALFLIVKIARLKFRSNKKEGEKSGPLTLEEMIGKTATTATDLVPHGQIYFGEEVLNAFSKEGHIKKGEKVVILRGEDGHFMVEIAPRD
jgi:membrane-bound ClpP family serine protease